MSRLQYAILGPLEVREGEDAVQLGGAKQRALLAVLLLRANEAVSKDRLIDELWGGAPPASASHSLEVYVSQLRKLLGENSEQPLVTQPRGYVLKVEPGALDLDRFERIVDDGRTALREGDPARASALLREGLALWRGAALADLSFDSSAAHEVARLDELRLAANEDRIEADLALGRHHELVGELEGLVREHPLRERARLQLMLALYRSGRQAEALEVYRETRRVLVAELGIEPGVALQRMEQAILAQDPSLDAPPTPVRHREARRLVPIVGLAALVVTALAAAIYALVGNTQHTLGGIDANALGLVDPQTGGVKSEVVLGSRPTKAAIGFGAIWVTHFSDNRVSRIDLATHTIRQTIVVGSGPSAVAVGGGAVWVANNLDGTVSRIDPRENTVVQTIDVGNDPTGIAFGAGAIWTANSSDHTISMIEPARGRVTATFPAGGDATGIAVGMDAVWVTNALDGTVSRIDPATKTVVQTIHVGNGPEAVATGAGAIWVANSRDDTVSRIDPQTNSVVATTRVGREPTGIGLTHDVVWVANAFDGTITTLDARTGAIKRTRHVGNLPRAVATSAQVVWVAVAAAGRAHRGGTLAISLPEVDLDTGHAYDAFSWILVVNTNDGLTGFKRVGGSEGTQVVPDLADALPAPTDDGKRYTFRLRAGIRYSTGALVRTSDFRRAIERLFPIQSGGAGFFTGVLGGAACAARPTHCDLHRGIVADDAARTLVFRLTAADPEFLYKLALPFAYPVPPGTPTAHKTSRPIPGTGPYAIANVGKRELRLVRNRYFHEWSKAAQPDGYPDEILARLTVETDRGIPDVERGKLDWIGFGTSAPKRLPELLVRYPARVRINSYPATNFMVMNTRLPPFDDLRVRRALNYAVDRKVWVAFAGGPRAAQPTCQVLPPSSPGFQRYCPFKAPDLKKARDLVAASGTKGMKVVVYTMVGYFTRNGRYFVSLLRRLGYRASLVQVPLVSYFPTISDTRNHVQIAFDNWIADYPAASDFIDVLLSCRSFQPASPANGNRAGFCDRKIDAQIGRALNVQANNPETVGPLWAHIDRALVDQAPWVPMTNPKAIDFVSERVGGYQYNPQWGMLIDQLWVR